MFLGIFFLIGERRYVENCNIECVKYSKKGVKCYKSSEKEKFFLGGNFREDLTKDEVVELSFEE